MSGPQDFIGRHRAFLPGSWNLVLREIGRLSYPRWDGWTCRASQTTIGQGTGHCREQVCRIIGRLTRYELPDQPGSYVLEKSYGIYRITGLDEHERYIHICPHPQCQAEISALWGNGGKAVIVQRRHQMAAAGRTGLQVPETLPTAARDAARACRGDLRLIS